MQRSHWRYLQAGGSTYQSDLKIIHRHGVILCNETPVRKGILSRNGHEGSPLSTISSAVAKEVQILELTQNEPGAGTGQPRATDDGIRRGVLRDSRF